MSGVRVAVGVLNQTPFAWEDNLANIRGAIDEARAQQASALCLPELCLTGYGCEDMFQARFVRRTAWSLLEALVPATAGLAVSVGLPVEHEGALYNAAALLVDGAIAGLVPKRFLAGDGLHYEPRWFKPWPPGAVSTFTPPGSHPNRSPIPIGDLTFDVGGTVIGFEICEDAWVASRRGADLSRDNVDVIFNPSASHFAFGKQRIRRRLVLEGSRAFGVGYLYANLLGNEAGRAIYDGGGLIANAGEMLAEMPRFSFAPFRIASAVVDLDLARLGRSRAAGVEPSVRPREGRVRTPFTLPEAPPERARSHRQAWETASSARHEAFARTLSLALFDYLRKSRTGGYVVSLSGGADSAACACLVALMVRYGIDELGLAGFAARLGHVDGLLPASGVAPANDQDAAAIVVGRLLTTVYQSTANSSETTRAAASGLAGALGARHHELDVDGIVRSYVALIEGAVGRELTWERDDLTLQNIQARARAPSAWMLANLAGQVLIATSNRSEAAVGYATMDGDTAGGLSPIAGIDKAYLRGWLRWLETEGPAGIGPIRALAAVNAQAPTAELRPTRPGAAPQTDEADLMPYPLLDAIERAAIRDKKDPVEVYARMRALFPDLDAATLRAWVSRFFRLWCRHQWKRERYAPSFHVDDENLDPKTWCRFPILSGGYARELAELAAVDETDARDPNPSADAGRSTD